MIRTWWFSKIKQNQWLVLAILFFVAWKFFLIDVLWQDRYLAPQPDDSYNYITHIAAIEHCSGFKLCSYPEISMRNSSGVVYLSYRLFFGALAKLTPFTAHEIYHYGFYFGTILLVLVLYPFLRIFTEDKQLIAWGIFFLSFYHGLGGAHGFFWVVPSFFTVILFFIILTYLFNKNRGVQLWYITALVIFYTFSHPISVYLIFILPITLFFFALFSKSFNSLTWTKVFIIVLMTILTSTISSHIISKSETEKNAYSVREMFISTASVTKNILNQFNAPPEQPPTVSIEPATSVQLGTAAKKSWFQQKTYILNDIYFHWVIPHWIFLIGLLLSLLILAVKKQFEILSLFFAAFFFFIATTLLHHFGYRSVIILWPITYIIFAFASWFFLKEVQTKTRGLLKFSLLIMTSALLITFFIANILYSYITNQNINVRDNYPIPSSLINYLLYEIPSERTISLPRELIISGKLSLLSLNKKFVTFESKPDYLVITDSSKMPTPKRSEFFKSIKHTAQLLGFSMRDDASVITSYQPPSGYILYKTFGIFDIYKKD